MPFDWLVWGTLAAQAAFNSAAGLATTSATRKAGKRIGEVLSGGPLEEPLEKAYAKAFNGFSRLFESFPLTYGNEEALKELPASDAFREVVGQLAHVPFHEI